MIVLIRFTFHARRVPGEHPRNPLALPYLGNDVILISPAYRLIGGPRRSAVNRADKLITGVLFGTVLHGGIIQQPKALCAQVEVRGWLYKTDTLRVSYLPENQKPPHTRRPASGRVTHTRAGRSWVQS